MTKTKTLPIDAHVIAIDITGDCEIDKADKKYIDRIYDVFLYDSNEVTHCCEITPSYFLRYLYTFFKGTGEYMAGELSENQREALHDKYETADSDDSYFHCGDIAKMVVEKAAQKPPLYLHHGGTEKSYEDETYEEQIERLIEHFSGNQPF